MVLQISLLSYINIFFTETLGCYTVGWEIWIAEAKKQNGSMA